MSSLDELYGESLGEELRRRKFFIKKKDGSLQILPLGLYPVSIRQKKYAQIKSMELNVVDQLMFKLATHELILAEVLEKTVQSDSFIKRLLDIHTKSLASRMFEKKLYFSIIRSDYFVDKDSQDWKLVEINTIAIAMALYADVLEQLHREKRAFRNEISNRSQKLVDCISIIHQRFLTDARLSEKSNDQIQTPEKSHWLFYNHLGEKSDLAKIFDSNSGSNGFVNDSKVRVSRPGVLVIADTQEVQPMEIVYRLSQTGMFPVVVSSLEDISHSEFRLTEEGRLHLTTRDKSFSDLISCVYFRLGYSPDHYVNERCWEFVEMAELSLAVLVPSVGLHLAGTKRVQCALYENNFQLLHQLMGESSDVEAFRSTFVDQFVLDEENVKKVLAAPERYVIKPQREGGGNNLFGDEIVQQFANKPNRSDLSTYVAMELITPAIITNYAGRASDGSILVMPEAAAEVGICSIFLFDPMARECDRVIRQEISGFGCKVKHACSNEGGISSDCGFASITECID
ncbi:uncharacterized protein LOC134851175 [Symsagittifera roscoffensis]|uniref:uncharacterized protein LOC134851175 n=1 Tax=Symsagittifera roscoffensis TaxID=84072 RepID=UPI00307C0549